MAAATAAGMDRRNQPVRDDRLHGAMEEIATRIRPVCRTMPEAEFRMLVERMATIQLKYTMRGAIPTRPRD